MKRNKMYEMHVICNLTMKIGGVRPHTNHHGGGTKRGHNGVKKFGLNQNFLDMGQKAKL